MRMLNIILALLIGAAPGVQAAGDAGLPGAYLNHTGGSQVTGMGRAFVGFAEGTDAIAWNASGLGLLRSNTVNLMHSQTVQQATLDSFAYAQPIYRYGGIGVNYIRLDSGSIPQTDELNRQVGDFSDVQDTLMVGYGITPYQPTKPRGIVRKFSLGGAIKYSRQSIAGLSVSGWGADIGGLAHLKHGFSAGMRIQNIIAPEFAYETASDTFPRLMTIGFAQRFFNEKLVGTTDFEKGDSGQKFKVRSGLESTLWRMVKLRGGFDLIEKEFSFGLGYLYGPYQINYTSKSNEAGHGHFFGLSYSFGGFPVSIQATPDTFSPVGLKKNTTLGIQVNHSKKIFGWEVQIRDQARDLVRVMRGSGSPPASLIWDGTNGLGVMVSGGLYTYSLTVIDEDGKKETTPQQVIKVEYGTPLDTLELHTR